MPALLRSHPDPAARRRAGLTRAAPYGTCTTGERPQPAGGGEPVAVVAEPGEQPGGRLGLRRPVLGPALANALGLSGAGPARRVP